MEIRYNQKQFRIWLILGSVMFALAVVAAIFDSGVRFSTLGIGAAYLGIAIYQKYTPYLIVKDGYIKADWGSKIALHEIIETKRFAGDYIFKSATKSITVDKNAVDKNSLADLESLFDDLRDGKYKTARL